MLVYTAPLLLKGERILAVTQVQMEEMVSQALGKTSQVEQVVQVLQLEAALAELPQHLEELQGTQAVLLEEVEVVHGSGLIKKVVAVVAEGEQPRHMLWVRSPLEPQYLSLLEVGAQGAMDGEMVAMVLVEKSASLGPERLSVLRPQSLRVLQDKSYEMVYANRIVSMSVQEQMS